MTDARPVLLIDFSALFRRAWHVASEQSHAFEATIAGVNRASAMLPDSLVAICCDGRGNWRKEIAPTYKANRESQPAALYGEMDRTLDRLRKDGRLIWKFDGFEADDVIATACQMGKTRGHWMRIVTHDKDLLQLLCPSIDYLAIHKTPWEVVGAEVVRLKYGVEAEQFGDWLALVGDSSDNIKGCPGVGGKTATALLAEFGTLDNLLKEADACNPKITPNATKNLIAFRAEIETARKLVSLSRDVPIRFEEIYEERKLEDLESRDHMAEAEADAAKYFGQENKDSETTGKAPDVADTGSATDAQTYPEQPEGEPSRVAETAPVAQAPVEKPRDVEIAIKAETTEIIPVAEYTRQLEPRSLREAVVYTTMMFNSRVYSRYPTINSMTAAVVRGREMGYGAGASLDLFHVADFRNDGNLRLMLHAHLVIERAMQHPDVEFIHMIKSTDTECTYKAKRRGHPDVTELTYTIAQAKLAGLVKPGSNWEKRPSEQLRKTCGVQISRIVAPSAALGLYCAEEMGIDNE